MPRTSGNICKSEKGVLTNSMKGREIKNASIALDKYRGRKVRMNLRMSADQFEGNGSVERPDILFNFS